jgi:type III restriction enzyme
MSRPRARFLAWSFGKTKIKCARKFFEDINQKFALEEVKYDVVDSLGKLVELVN